MSYRYSPTGERTDIGDERYDNPDNVEMPITEAIEENVVFEDEHPKYIGNVSNVGSEEKKELDEDKKPTGNVYPIYTFKDTGLKNFTKDFLLEELRLIFQTGKLAGLDFALTLIKSDSTGMTFELSVTRITAAIFLMLYFPLKQLTQKTGNLSPLILMSSMALIQHSSPNRCYLMQSKNYTKRPRST